MPFNGYEADVAIDDDDDWVGEPPEGFHRRDQAKPDFWRHNAARLIGGAAFGLALLILVVVLLLS